ncbi:methyltransferase domain-containing protein [Candidatus Woesearchaeota archaeon]|nr:methyltransferase domain-containing protein [Candidatus Woesearchaeota archaeon]
MAKIQAMSYPGLHTYVVRNYFKRVPKDARILILGSGEGAFEEQLLSLGYTSIFAVDYYTDYKLKDEVPFMRSDFNKPDFASKILKRFGKPFDVVVTIEVLEHVYSTDNFLANIRKLLAPKGICILTTPNLHSFMARLDNLITGYPTLFIDPPKLGDHVNPIFHSAFSLFIELNKLRIRRLDHYGSFWGYLKRYRKESVRGWVHVCMLAILVVVLNPLMLLNRNLTNGHKSIYTITM